MEQLSTILLVEDDANDLFLIRRSIARSRLANPVQVVRDGEEAIAYLSGEGDYADRKAYPLPFLLFLDLHMPRVNGFELLRWIRARPEFRNLKIVVLTSSSEQRDYTKALELGADSYFLKPGSLEEFVGLMLRIHGHWLLIDQTEAPANPSSSTVGVA